jgi:hypothetical protein
MLEILRHSFGMCGEGHSNLVYFITAIPLELYLSIVRTKVFLYSKNFLKRLYSHYYLN